jgi:hypothetical protein
MFLGCNLPMDNVPAWTPPATRRDWYVASLRAGMKSLEQQARPGSKSVAQRWERSGQRPAWTCQCKKCLRVMSSKVVARDGIGLLVSIKNL